MKTVLLVLTCVVINTLAQLWLRQGAASHGKAIATDARSMAAWWMVLSSGPVLLGLVLWTVSTLIWIYVLSQNGLVLAFGLYGLNYVLVPLAAHWRFAEPISSLQTIGMSLTALGVACTVAGRSPT